MAHWCEALQGLVDADVLQRAAHEEMEGRDPVDYLVARRCVTPLVVLTALANHHRCPFVLLRHYAPDPRAVNLVPYESAQRFHVLPLFEIDDNLYLAVADVLDLAAQDYLQRTTGMFIHPVLALRDDLDEALKRHYLGRESAAQTIGAISAARPETPSAVATPLSIEDDEAPLIRLLNYILHHAIQLRASDVHFEPYPNHMVLRYRIDGILHEFPPPPLYLHRALVSRLKVLAALDISEKRLPQDGRLTFPVAGRDYDLRLSVIPGVHGESAVVRILDSAGTRTDLADLGFDEGLLRRYEKIIARPYGMVLVTGPTGSGKSTTLYTTLRRICSPRRKIVTLEDPVECHLQGVTQLQINPAIGFTFSQGLRSVLRHDPDVIMLGEIRDLESAEIALRSSLTGHLLFSTLHTNNAALALSRLVDMGIPAYLVLSSLIAVLAQRLVRRLCPECRVPVHLDPQQLMAAGISTLPPGTVLYGPKGCDSCGRLGYQGRVGVHELLEITSRIRKLSGEELLPEIITEGLDFVTLRQSAVAKLRAGLTSLEEVTSLVTDED